MSPHVGEGLRDWSGGGGTPLRPLPRRPVADLAAAPPLFALPGARGLYLQVMPPLSLPCYGIRSASMTRRPGFVVAMSSGGPAASRTSAMVPSCRRALLCRPPLPHQRHGRCAREGYWGRIRRVRPWMKKQPIHIEASGECLREIGC